MTPSENSMKKYDGLYIFAGSAKDDVLDKQIDKVRGEITRLSGNVLTTEVLPFLEVRPVMRLKLS